MYIYPLNYLSSNLTIKLNCSVFIHPAIYPSSHLSIQLYIYTSSIYEAISIYTIVIYQAVRLSYLYIQLSWILHLPSFVSLLVLKPQAQNTLTTSIVWIIAFRRNVFLCIWPLLTGNVHGYCQQALGGDTWLSRAKQSTLAWPEPSTSTPICSTSFTSPHSPPAVPLY